MFLAQLEGKHCLLALGHAVFSDACPEASPGFGRSCALCDHALE